MDVHTGNIRENYKKAADDKSYLDLFGWGGGPLCAAVSSVAFWNFPVHYCVVCSALVYDLQGNESWCSSVTQEDCAFCPVWKNVSSFIEASLISDNCSLKRHLHENTDRIITWI